LVARTIRRPPALTVAPATSSPGLLLDGDGLTGQQRLVDRARALLDDAVGGDLLAGADDEAVARRELLDRHAALGPVGVEHGDILGAELEQRLEGGAGAALGARLEEAAGEQERRHDRAHLEVDLVRAAARAIGDQVERHSHARHAGVAEEERVQRPAEGREHAERDQRVHRRRAVLEVRPRRAVEGPRAPQDHRRRELQAQPLPVVELQRADHRDRQQRRRQQGRDEQTPPQRRVRVGLGGVGRGLVGRERRLVAGRLDRRHELAGIDRGGVEVDGRPLGRVVDRGGDAVELVEAALDAVRARGARHAADRQLECHRYATSCVKAAVWTRPSCWNCRNRR
jgi:hypothetical protein